MMMLLQLLLISVSLHAKGPVVLNCKDQIDSLQKDWGKKGNWDDKTNGLFISSTDEFGKWIWYKDEGDSITLTKASQTEQLRVNFKKSNCERQLMVVNVPSENAADNDETLKQKISLKNGLIYIWSPQMPLSYRGIQSIEAAAKKNKLNLTVYLDPAARLPRNHQYNTKYLNRINSFDLKMRNAYVHMPSLLAYKKGTVQETVKYGYETAEGYEKDIKDVFNF